VILQKKKAETYAGKKKHPRKIDLNNGKRLGREEPGEERHVGQKFPLSHGKGGGRSLRILGSERATRAEKKKIRGGKMENTPLLSWGGGVGRRKATEDQV